MASDCFVSPLITSFLASLRRPLPDPLPEWESEVRTAGFPVASAETVDLLRFLCTAVHPRRILEIGACVGFSSVVMASVCSDALIDTVERSPYMLDEMRKTFARFPKQAEQICLYEGDAAAVLPRLSGPYDLIFLDAAKGQYPRFFDHCRELLREGGVFVADNVLFRGFVAEGKPDVHRNQTIVNRLTEFLTRLNGDPSFVTVTLPISDGVTLSVKKRSVSPDEKA